MDKIEDKILVLENKVEEMNYSVKVYDDNDDGEDEDDDDNSIGKELWDTANKPNLCVTGLAFGKKYYPV